jgi:hypothetical protein
MNKSRVNAERLFSVAFESGLKEENVATPGYLRQSCTLESHKCNPGLSNICYHGNKLAS